ncbi:hypothetical protein SAMN05421858_0417 [Haladaptatus litoreus]|uniref:Uncharacterized protein n=1 Tax=Haladaptatus litoreus TaxID=553468 RepID=A0A1N6VMV9_9EURY|nr:DUF5787 family protein [Haladaptatus litoreus]SIQ79175.1 hypothetical protein SAMN05421858_0417 [Haladaptatus litoreus]
MAEPEFTFELRTCRWAERCWPPEGRERPVLVSRQLGTKRRRWDTVVVEVDADAFARRAQFGRKRLDGNLLHVVRNAPEVWEWYQDALPDPGYPWRYVRETIHEADDRRVLDVRKRGRKLEIRRRWEYPDWVRRIVAIENKPDLDASAARNLRPQIERDVALALADEVWVATRATGDRVEPALLESLPVEAGILTFSGDENDDYGGFDENQTNVAWFPRTLDVDAPGTRIVERPSGGKYDQSAATFEYVEPAKKRKKRLEIAERAYERGWRSYTRTMRPDCRYFELRHENEMLLPHCSAKSCSQTASKCSGRCSDFEPEPPTWRQKEWPIEGGPGKAIQRLLDSRRERFRPD